jgi:3-oxoacyl-[acyl-carrier-protein] synthase-3
MLETTARPRSALGSQRPVVGAALGAVGMAVPEQVIENAPISERLGVDEDWIVSRTGVSRRHALASGERLSDIAAKAGEAALAEAGIDPGDLDLVLVGTTSKDHLTPDAAPVVAAELGAAGAGAFDVGAACTAFVAALAVARAIPYPALVWQIARLLAQAAAGADRMDEARAAAVEVQATIARLAERAPEPALRRTFLAWPRVQAALEEAERLRSS